MWVTKEIRIIAERMADTYKGSKLDYGRYLNVATLIYMDLKDQGCFCKCD